MNNLKNNENNQKVIGVLNPVLAGMLHITLGAKYAHWNVKGRHFISLHELFDKVFESLLDGTDMIAERIIQLGSVAQSSPSWILKNTFLKDLNHETSSSEEYITFIVDSLKTLATRIKEGITHINELDVATADLLTEVLRNLDVYIWKVGAHLEEK